jgi:hypothetical protein
MKNQKTTAPRASTMTTNKTPCKRLPRGTDRETLMLRHRVKVDLKRDRNNRLTPIAQEPERIARLAGRGRRNFRFNDCSIAAANRHTGEIHLHAGERTRRLDQAFVRGIVMARRLDA